MFKTIPKDQITEMLKQAVYHQLFAGKDEILGKLTPDRIKFDGAGALLDKFIKLILDNLDILDPNDLKKFLNKFEKFFGYNLSDVKYHIEQNLKGMDEIEGQEVAFLYMVLTKMLENIRNQAYVFNGLNELVQYFQEHNLEFTDEVHNKLNDMAMNCNPQISLIYNLCFLLLLADKFKNESAKKNAKKLIIKNISILAKSIIEEEKS